MKMPSATLLTDRSNFGRIPQPLEPRRRLPHGRTRLAAKRKELAVKIGWAAPKARSRPLCAGAQNRKQHGKKLTVAIDD
jgi:hypothetical protein